MPKRKISKKDIEMKIREPEIIDEGEYVFDIPQQEVDIQAAPFWRRVVAYLIDAIFFYFLPFQIFMAIYLPKVGLGFENVSAMQAYINAMPTAQMRLIVGFVAALFVFLFYFMLLEKNFKTTIGKKIMKLQIGGKKELSYWDVFIRNLTKTVLFYLLPLDLLGIVFNKGQRFSEKITNTKVIYFSPLSLVYESW